MHEWISGDTNAAVSLSPRRIWECRYTEAFVASALGDGERWVREIGSSKVPTTVISPSTLSTWRRKHVFSPKRLVYFGLIRRTVPKILVTYITPLSESFKVQLYFRLTPRPLYPWGNKLLYRRLGGSQPVWTYGEGKVVWEWKLRCPCSCRHCTDRAILCPWHYGRACGAANSVFIFSCLYYVRSNMEVQLEGWRVFVLQSGLCSCGVVVERVPEYLAFLVWWVFFCVYT
jgi:hypothetical protein